jgi:glycosyltransferase involved in cell wall biosynthesis
MISTIQVSIIIPIYNVADYLPKCISSVLAQSYPNLEILLVNDGSTDNSLEICEGYAKQDARIRVIDQENGGISAARNAGIDGASGAYLAFIDGDDFLHQDFIFRLLHSLLKTQSQISVSNFLIMEWDEIPTENPIFSDVDDIVYNPSDMVMNFYQNRNPFPFVTVTGKLYEASLFHQFRFPLVDLHEDEFTNYLLIFRATKIVFLSKQMYYYVNRASSLTHSPYSLKNLLKLEALEQRILFFKEQNEITLKNETMFAYIKLLMSNSINLKLYLPEEKDVYENLMQKYNKTYQSLLRADISAMRKIYLFFAFPFLVRSKLFLASRKIFYVIHMKLGRNF